MYSNGYWVMDGGHVDGPFDAAEAIQFMLKFVEYASPEMFRIVLTRWDDPPEVGKSLKLCKVDGIPLNVGYLANELAFNASRDDIDFWLSTHEIKAI